MGTGSWSKSDWTSYSNTRNLGTASKQELFPERKMNSMLSPHGISVRESVDSDDNPNSTPIMIFSDVTGSMGSIAETIIRRQCNELMESLISSDGVRNPHVLFGAIGDLECDKAPLQITQFEADIRIAEQLQMVFLEGGGGGNGYESYHLPWYFAARHTTHDAYNKRGKKGFLFTIGDEPPPPKLTADQIRSVFGHGDERDYTPRELFEIASERYHVFHILLNTVGWCSSSRARVAAEDQWKQLLGEHVIMCDQLSGLSNIIINKIISLSDNDY